MNSNSKQYAQALLDIIKNINEQQSKNIIKKFIEILIKKNQISKLEEIVTYFSNLWNKEKKIIEVEIISAHKLDKQTIRMLINYINKLLKTQHIIIHQKIDKNIFGGFVMRYRDKILDQSLKRRVRELREVVS